tara:strand:+ start:530 stop:1459 length:930 start_codon:yes stop_codon:yes gene_type:complete
MMMNEENQQQEAEKEAVTVFDIEDQESSQSEVETASASNDDDSSTIVPDESENSDELENYSDRVQKRINKLTADRKQALEESEAAYQYAQQMKSQNDALRKQYEALDKGYINEYGSRVETQEAAAKRILRDATDAGDVDKIAEATAALAQVQIEKERLRVQKNRSEQQAEAPQEQNAPQRQAQQQPQELDPKLKSWLSKNPWFGADKALTGAAQGIHEQIVAEEGFDPKTDEYYAEIDKRMSFYLEKSQGNRRNAQSVAPASNGRSATKKGGKQTVKLTESQMNFCRKMKIPPEQYAKEVLRLEKQRSA